MIPVIIPYYKNKDNLDKCIAHLKNQTVELEIFIRDNNIDNIYFTAAINEGIRKLLNQQCSYIIILNQDMYLERTAVENMVTFMDSHPKCGIGVPLQIDSKNPEYVNCAGGLNAFPFGKHVHGPLSEFTDDEQISWGNGACMIFRKEMIQEIGLMDENFILIGSDSDYCFTARSRGWQVWRISGARGLHECSTSGTLTYPHIEKLKITDMIYFGQKWLTGQLYEQLACDGENFTAEMIDKIMSELKKVKIDLEKSTNHLVVQHAADKVDINL